MQDLLSLKKAELHIHIEGSIRLETLNRLAYRKGLPAFEKTPYRFSNFDEFYDIFPRIGRYFNTDEDFHEITLALGQELLEQGIIYCEAIIMPYVHVKRGIPFNDLINAIDCALSELEQGNDLNVKLICTIPRTMGTEAGQETLKWIEQNACNRIIGIDLAGKELPGTISPFARVFERARAMGLKTTAHAGEFLGPQAIWETLEFLNPDRIGHGISAIHDDKLISELAKRQIPLDISITSNLKLNAINDLRSHPVRRFFNSGIPITINTDDPAFFDTSLCREYMLLRDELGFSYHDIEELIENALLYSQ
jgi:adenosine deaminase